MPMDGVYGRPPAFLYAMVALVALLIQIPTDHDMAIHIGDQEPALLVIPKAKRAPESRECKAPIGALPVEL